MSSYQPTKKHKLNAEVRDKVHMNKMTICKVNHNVIANFHDNLHSLTEKETFNKLNHKIKLGRDDYLKLKDDNEALSKMFKQSTKLKQYLQNSKRSRNKLNDPHTLTSNFQDLIHTYKHKGYSIPNLSVENNIFKQCPLLMENTKIDRLYKYKTNSESLNQLDKNAKFLIKMSNALLEKISEKKKMSNNDYTYATRLFQRTTTLKLTIEEHEPLSRKSIGEIVKYNQSVEGIIDGITKNNPIFISEKLKNGTSNQRRSSFVYVGDNVKRSPSCHKLNKFKSISNPIIPSDEEKIRKSPMKLTRTKMSSKEVVKTSNFYQAQERSNTNVKRNVTLPVQMSRDKFSILEKTRYGRYRPSLDQIKEDKSKILHYAYDKILSKDYTNLNQILDYYLKNVKHLKQDDIKTLFEVTSDPKKLLSAIEEVRKKIEIYNVNEVFMTKYANENLKEKALPLLDKVSKLDNIIKDLSTHLATKINQNHLSS